MIASTSRSLNYSWCTPNFYIRKSSFIFLHFLKMQAENFSDELQAGVMLRCWKFPGEPPELEEAVHFKIIIKEM